ncbi:MAG: right-handed parallel beta-helix repeat-containing protein, partial [Anaerolineae bacterium]|nr:right-handed parallel beta-helix repeat-containing protein [Anaerolineae bacterium]
MNGDDNNPGTTEDKPFRTLQRAAGIVKAGDIVLVKQGTYAGFHIRDKNGQANAWIVFKPYPGHHVIIDSYTNSYANTWRGVEISQCSYIEINGFEITDSNPLYRSDNFKDYSQGRSHDGIKLNGDPRSDIGPSFIRIVNNHIHHTGSNSILGGGPYNEFINNHIHHSGLSKLGYGMYINGGDGIIIRDNHIHDAYGFGIHVFDSSNLWSQYVIENNLIHNNGRLDYGKGYVKPAGERKGDGIIAYGNEHIIRNNIVYDNINWGIRTRSAYSLVVNNTLYNNGLQGIYAYNSIDAIVRNNIAYQNRGEDGYSGDYYIGPGNIQDHNLFSINPKFVDAAKGDFHLQAGSPAIDAGIPISGFKTDVGGTIRPQGTGWDIGAYEYGGVKQNTSPKAKIAADALGGEAPLTVDFDGSQSIDLDGFIQSYLWNFGDGQASQAQNPPPHTFASAGQYLVTLAVTDNSGAIGRDSITVSVVAPGIYTYIYLEAEGGNIISPMQIGSDAIASSGAYIYTPAGTGNTTSPAAEAGYQIELANSGLYYLWMRTYAPSSNNDATYAGFNGSYVRIFPQNTNVYEWVKAGDTYNLNAGPNQINIGHGEEQARVDRLLITNDSNFIPKATDGPPTASIALSDPSPTRAGQVQVILTTSNVVTKLPTPLIFTESDNSTNQIDLSGSVPGDTFTGIFVVDETVADGIGYFALPAGALIDVNGIKGNEIKSGVFVRIDKTPPANPQ